MARRHPATERFRGSATGSRRSPGLRFEMDMRLAIGLEREGAVQDVVPGIGTIRRQGGRRAPHLPGGAEAGDLLHAVDRIRQITEEGGTLADAAEALIDDLESAEVESVPLEPGRRAVVRLMNLHKAKGLEAPKRPQNLSYSPPSEDGEAAVVGSTTTAEDDVFAGASRNAECPCGSGKKYKKCHGAPGGPTGLTTRVNG